MPLNESASSDATIAIDSTQTVDLSNGYIDSSILPDTSASTLVLLDEPVSSLASLLTAQTVIVGSAEDETLVGTSASERLEGQAGNDVLTGMGGQDVFVFTLDSGIDTITDFGGVGSGRNGDPALLPETDLLQFEGAGLTAENLLLSYDGQDTTLSFAGVPGLQVILQNFDFTDLDNLADGVGNILFDGQTAIVDAYDVADDNTSRNPGVREGTVTYLNNAINQVSGRGSDDVINGLAGDDQLTGGNGDDLLRGQEGRDNLTGSNGNDVLEGGDGNDRLQGGSDNDELFGGLGNDNLSGGNEDDLLEGGEDNDTLSGGRGNDVMRGDAGNDQIRGADGDDVLEGGDGSDRLFGGRDNDLLDGGLGRDNLSGEDGNDVLLIYEGADQAFGGSGNDEFWVASQVFPAEASRVRDFQPGQDTVVIDRLPNVNTFADLDVRRSGRDTAIRAQGNFLVTLSGVQPEDLTEGDFRIIPGGGSNEPPVTEPNKTLTVDEDSGATPLDIAAPTDADGDPLTVTVLSVATAGQGTVQLADGTPVAVDQALTVDELQELQLVLEPNANGDAGNFSYRVEDNQGGTASQHITFTIVPVNDAPVLTVPGAQSTSDNTALAINGISVDDIDVAAGELEVALTVAEGTLSLGVTAGLTFGTGDGTEDGALTFTGNLTDINVALSTLSYRSAAGFAGQDTLNLTVSDLGNTGAGGALTDSAAIALNVTATSASTNTIAGTVFLDENGNAVLDGTEVGQAGVTVFLDLNQNGFLNPGEPSQVTDSDGEYRFEDAPSGSYLVWEAVPDGFEQTAPASFFTAVDLDGSTTIENVDFGNQAFVFPTGTGEITGFKWEDINANGIRDTELVQGSNPDIVFVIDVSGSADFNFVGSNIGDFNGDGRSNTRLDAEIAGFIALNDQLVAQGLGEAAEVGIVVFSGFAAQADMNTTADGVQLLATPLADEDGNGVSDVEDILRSLNSGAFGVGNFTGTNFEVALRDVEDTFNTVGTPVGSGNVVFLSDGEVNRGGSLSDEIARLDALGVNISAFGVGSDASLPDLRNVDPDAEIFVTAEELIGVFSNLDAGEDLFVEPTIEGFTVFLDLNENGQLDPNEPTQVTDADGNYRFSGLAAGSYQVREIQQSGFGQTFPFAQEVTTNDGSTVTVPGFHTVTVTEGEVSDGFNFGNKLRTGEIRGVKWEDLNGDGVFDDDESTLEGVTVYLDLNQNGRIDINEPSQQTDANGRYRFRDLDAGPYSVREVVPFEFAQTAPVDAYEVDLGVGEVIEDLNFGNQFVGFNTPPEIVSTPVIDYTLPPAPVETVEFVDFSDLSNIQLGGDAARLTPVADGRNILRLVDSERPFESGNALVQNPFDLFGPGNEPLSFSTNFQFQITEPGGITDEDGAGADGIAFVLTPNTNLGGAGIGIGYQGLQNTVAIEFDTYNNGAIDDNNGNHVGLALNGNNNAVAQTAVTPRFNNGEVWNAWIEYDGVSQQIEVWASLSTERPDDPLLSESVDIPAIVGADEFFIGFTSATGAAFGVHDILSWNFATGQFLEEPDDYAYQVIATDEESDPLTYTLTEAPNGAGVDATTGELVWDSSFITPGSYDFTVQVNDGRGGTDEQSYVLEVVEGIPDAAPNQAPTIVTDPTFNVAPENLYFYNVNAIDPENTTLTYSLDANAPDGMQIDSDTGVIRWTPTTAQVGEFPLTVTATDADGAFATQTFTITVDPAFADLPNPELPTVEFGFSSNVVAIGEELNLQVRGTDGDGLANLELTANGTPIALDSSEIRSGSINGSTLLFTEAGLVELVATATDTNGNVGTETLTIRVTDPNDTTPPVTELDLTQFEGDGSVITAPIDIIGTVEDDSLEFYRLEIAPIDLVNPNNPTAPDDDYRVLAEGTGSVDGVLGQVDPTLLANGNYFLRVVTGDFSGNVDAQGTTVSIAGNLKLGRYTQEFTDIEIPLAGIPVEVNRVYDSLEANRSGDFGFGWSLGTQDARIQESVPVTDFNGFGLFTSTPFAVGDTVTLTNPDGERVSFTFDPVVTSFSLLGPIWSPRFVPEPGVYDTLEVSSTPLSIRSDGKAGLFLFGLPYNPSQYQLTTQEGLTYQYDQFDGLLSIRDRNDNSVNFSNSGIQSSTGANIQFLRDTQGRISEIVDPVGNRVQYVYDQNGDLVEVIDQVGLTTQHEYFEELPHYLERVIDPLGQDIIKIEYDENGQVRATSDAIGRSIESTYELINGGAIETQVDPLGNTTITEKDARGNVVAITDARGATRRFIYDENNNQISETDPLGFTVNRTYDENGNVTRISEPLGLITEIQYDQFNNITQLTDPLGRITTYEYDALGNLKTLIDPLGAVGSLERDEFGRLTSSTDPNGNTVEYVFTDSFSDRPNKVLFNDGSRQQYTYNALGQVETVIDENGNRTELVTDAIGRLLRQRDAFGNETVYTYDGPNLTGVTDALGNITTFEYNETGQIIRRVTPDGGITEYEYDSLGRLIRETNPLGQTTVRSYDAVGLVDAIIDAEGGLTQFEYDLNGNLLAITDPINQETQFEYDALGRIIGRTDPVGNDETFTYDAVDNLIRVVDRDGLAQNFEYDASDQLTQERWLNSDGSVSRQIELDYDAAGNLLSVQDANSSYIFTYNNRNRVVQTTQSLAPGLDPFTFNYSYDQVGNVISVSDGLGTEVKSTYDPLNRLVAQTWEGLGTDEARIEMTYDAVGNLTQIERFSDLAGTQLISTTSNGFDPVQTDSTFNARSYNSRGDRSQTEELSTLLNSGAPVLDTLDDNALQTGGTAVPRITQTTNTDEAGNEVSSYSLEYDLTGQLLRETTAGNVTDYSYDANGQLLTADRSDFADETYTYDANGNRTSGGSVVGDNNQIVSDGTFTYLYDARGNIASKLNTNTNERTEYTYNHRNQLVAVTRKDASDQVLQTVEYAYDAFDRRISESIDGETNYFVHNGENAWADLNSDSEITARYLSEDKIDGLVARYRPEEGVAWYLKDRLGSIRDIVNNEGVLINHIDYDSFGRILNQTNTAAGDRFGFNGREYSDATGLYYYRARYYDPALGRFISEDPTAFDAGDSNLYRYVGNSPLNGIDPLGLVSQAEYTAISRAIVATVRRCITRTVGASVVTSALESGLYLFLLPDGSWYAGMTNDYDRRLAEHRRGARRYISTTVQKIPFPASDRDLLNKIEQYLYEVADEFFDNLTDDNRNDNRRRPRSPKRPKLDC